MAVVNANCLAIYIDSVDSQTKIKTLAPYASTSSAAQAATVDYTRAIVADSDPTSGENNIFIGYGEIDHGTDAFTDQLDRLDLVGAATSSNLDLTNSIENVARDGEGGTLQESNQEWTITCDGLIQTSDDAGVSIMDMARNKYYAIVKFSIDKDGTDIDYYGQVLIESVQLSGGVDEIATYSVTLTGVDQLLKEA
jgi:hypothetical protein